MEWHDGVPFIAKDVKHTFEAIKKYKGIAYSLLKMDKLVAIETPDDYTVIFRYPEPFPAFLPTSLDHPLGTDNLGRDLPK